jgi:uncharacterized protein YbjT (DUF2867 family)
LNVEAADGRSPGMKAFVAGATGLTGRSVVEAIARARETVIAHVRPDSPRLEEWRARFTALGAIVDASAWKERAITAALAAHAPSHVFGLLGTTQARVKRVARAGGDASKETYDAVDIALTEMLIRASAALDAKPRFVYLSSVGAEGDARGSYLAARARVERTLSASGLPYTIARPSFIVGDRDDVRAAEKIFAPIADASLSLLGALGARKTSARYRSITGDQLARALVAVASDPAWEGRVAEAEDLQALARRSG